MTKTAGLKSIQAMLLADPYGVAAKSAFLLSGAVAVATLAVALYALAPSLKSDRSAPVALAQDAVAARWSPSAAEPEGEPVRVTNPFDASEVFEFPAGTTPAEARAMMTEMLMDRARDRYARLDRRS